MIKGLEIEEVTVNETNLVGAYSLIHQSGETIREIHKVAKKYIGEEIHKAILKELGL